MFMCKLCDPKPSLVYVNKMNWINNLLYWSSAKYKKDLAKCKTQLRSAFQLGFIAINALHIMQYTNSQDVDIKNVICLGGSSKYSLLLFIIHVCAFNCKREDQMSK